MKIEYRVRPVTRYVVTRHHETDEGCTGGSEAKGEYNNPNVAYEVAHALCKAEHDALGYPPGDERVQYPKRLDMASATTGALLGSLDGSGAQRLVSREELYAAAITDGVIRRV